MRPRVAARAAVGSRVKRRAVRTDWPGEGPAQGEHEVVQVLSREVRVMDENRIYSGVRLPRRRRATRSERAVKINRLLEVGCARR